MYYRIARWVKRRPDGTIEETGYIGSFDPYIFKGKTLDEIKKDAKERLGEGFELAELIEVDAPDSGYYYWHDDWGTYID